MPGDNLQDEQMLLEEQNRPKKPKRKFTYAKKTKGTKGEGFLPSGFETRNPD